MEWRRRPCQGPPLSKQTSMSARDLKRKCSSMRRLTMGDLPSSDVNSIIRLLAVPVAKPVLQCQSGPRCEWPGGDGVGGIPEGFAVGVDIVLENDCDEDSGRVLRYVGMIQDAIEFATWDARLEVFGWKEGQEMGSREEAGWISMGVSQADGSSGGASRRVAIVSLL